MAEKIQAIRGMNDILPEHGMQWRAIEQDFSACLLRYGYQELRTPILESTHLFKRTIGEVTDIVEKEMYTFTDLNGDSLTLRPEGTASCVRACLEHGLLHNQSQKLWYFGPMFRHEKPQKGRYRQFHQFGVEALNISGAAIELELISLSLRLFKQWHIDHVLRLQINTLGTLCERQAYKELLVTYLCEHKALLDEDSLKRLEKNPLRILDSKNPEMRRLIDNAPRLIDALGEESKNRFNAVCHGLDELNIAYEINPFLVRGLDYYGHTVFEWVTDKLGSQATVCAGGRYDGLVSQLGGQSVPAIGFAMGIERILILLETLNINIAPDVAPELFLMASSEGSLARLMVLGEHLRDQFPQWSIITNTVLSGFKSQFKKADKSGAQLALLLGDEEFENQQITVKYLRSETEQVTISQSELVGFLQRYFASSAQ